MSSRPGFDVMDVDVSIADDTKFKRIWRANPEFVAPAFMAYVALVAESWKAAERVAIEDAWPALLPFDGAVVDAMKGAQLVDKSGRVPATAWKKRFTEANQRRIRARDRYARYNAKRGQPRTNDDVEQTSLPRGTDVATTASEPFRTVPNRSEPKVVAREAGPRQSSPAQRVKAWLRDHEVAQPVGWEASKVNELSRQFGADAVIAAFEEARQTGSAVTCRNFVRWAEQSLSPDVGPRNGSVPKGHTRTAKEAIDAFRR